jgi:hypothetical protein
MCIVGGGTLESDSFRSPIVGFASFLGTGALVLIVVGLVTGTRTPFVLLAVDTGLLWIVSTLRHATAAQPSGEVHATAHA